MLFVEYRNDQHHTFGRLLFDLLSLKSQLCRWNILFDLDCSQNNQLGMKSKFLGFLVVPQKYLQIGDKTLGEDVGKGGGGGQQKEIKKYSIVS